MSYLSSKKLAEKQFFRAISRSNKHAVHLDWNFFFNMEVGVWWEGFPQEKNSLKN